MTGKQRITPCLWFDSESEEAAAFYTSRFHDGAVGHVTTYGEERQEIAGQPPGTMMTVDFELAGYRFTALNSGPDFRFTPAISFYVTCALPSEVDALWEPLADGGHALMELGTYGWSERYGWVQDLYGVTW